MYVNWKLNYYLPNIQLFSIMHYKTWSTSAKKRWKTILSCSLSRNRNSQLLLFPNVFAFPLYFPPSRYNCPKGCFLIRLLFQLKEIATNKEIVFPYNFFNSLKTGIIQQCIPYENPALLEQPHNPGHNTILCSTILLCTSN